jgi:hypothetical protein
MIVEKKAKTNIPKKAKSKSWCGYKDEFLFMNEPIRTRFVEKLCTDLEKESITDRDFLILSQFWQKNGVRQQTVDNWRKIYPELDRAVEEAKIALGNKRLMGALKKELSESLVARSMHMFDPEWKKSDEFHASLRNINDVKKEDIRIYLNDIPSSGVVPEKVEHGNRDSSTSE